MQVIIDGKEVQTTGKETLLELCRRTGTKVPSLCHAPGAVHKPSCMVCMVRNEANGQMIPSCATYPFDGMRIDTASNEVKAQRTLAVELLLSDHRADCEAPCSTVCPHQLDVAAVLYQYDKGNYALAKGFLKALPENACDACKAPCEKVCRRGRVDAHVEIRRVIRELLSMDIPAEKPAESPAAPAFSSKLGSFTPQEIIRIKAEPTTASTCLHCACLAKDDCRLREVAAETGVRSSRLGLNSALPMKAAKRITAHLVFEPAKCIRCGLCVYNSTDGFTFQGRGFTMQVVLPEESYGNVQEELADLCPTGALTREKE